MNSTIWETCLNHFRQILDETSFDAFIRPTYLKSSGKDFFLVTPNKVTQRWLKQNVESHLLSLIQLHHQDVTSLSYQISELNATIDDINSEEIKKISPPTELSSTKKTRSGDTSLRKEVTFDSFILGHANEIAFAAAKTVANGNSNFNPLFIYGNTGLGKTHLAHAIGNQYLCFHPERKVRYTTGRLFMKEVVQAFRSNQHNYFQSRYHNLDMLIVDDIQYIGGDKVRTQEEFFFLFNTLYEEGKIVIITCDRSPTYIKNLPPRLISRFYGGVTTRIAAPEFELRTDILRQKALQWNLNLDEEVTAFIAEHIKSNVRELEGALKRVSAMASFQNQAITTKLCHQALADLIGKANIIIQPETIKDRVALFYNIRLSDLSSKKRNRSIVRPRHVAIYLCRQMTKLSLPDIGQLFGKRNHSTILHSCRFIEQTIKIDKNLADDIKHLEFSIKEAYS